MIADLCRAAGVPETALHRETRSTSTRQNLRNARPILQRLGAGTVVLVTDPYHAPRARLIARQEGIAACTDCPAWHAIGPRQWLRHLPREAVALSATLLRLR
ncbi:MAG: hypothetical protein HLUCCA12_08970 [Rhodobacteraceae bacterium HLUCCA12]|nr:MAG: hypothetical protein HLUCCA12_08970 [Rhodobacteraceae bacterium HLUCCA12]